MAVKRRSGRAPQESNKRSLLATGGSNSIPETLVIGVDFGTTFTSVSFGWRRTRRAAWEESGSIEEAFRDLKPITQWQNRPDLMEVPSILRYSHDGTKSEWAIKAANVERLGQEYANTEAVHFVKLSLHPSIETKPVRDAITELGKSFTPSKKGEDMVADFLKHLYVDLMGDSGFFKTSYRDLIQKTDVKWVFGAPASWTESEHGSMLRAARTAGMTDISRVSEPEAMAHVYFADPSEPIRLNETYIICDCGGGTVDVSSYTIRTLNPLTVSEAAVGEGRLCGSTFLNQNFKFLVSKKLKTEKYLHHRLEKILSVANLEFDKWIKPGFGSSSSDIYHDIIVAGLKINPKRGFPNAERLRVTDDEMRSEVFDPIVNQIIHLVKDHILAAQREAEIKLRYEGVENSSPSHPLIKRIILGGGFGANPYLFSRLTAEFYDNVSGRRKIPVSRGALGKDSVAKGAALFGLLDSFVAERLSCKNYGIDTRYAYDRHKHGSPDENVLEHEMGDVARIRIIDWVIKKGQSLYREKVENFKRERFVSAAVEDGESTVSIEHTETIIESEADVSDGPFTKIPHGKYPAHCQVHTLKIIFRDIPIEKLRWNAASKMYEIYYVIHLKVDGDVMVWAASTEAKAKGGHSYAEVHKYQGFLDSSACSSKAFGTLRNREYRAPTKADIIDYGLSMFDGRC